MIVVESIPQGIIDHGIYQRVVSHAVAEASLHQCVGSHGHAFHTARNDDLCLSGADHGRRCVNSVQTGTADNVHGYCRALYRKSCLNGCLTCYILSKPGLDDAPHINHVYFFRGNTGSLQSLFDNNRSHINCGCC